MFFGKLRAEYEAIIQTYRNDLADARAEIIRIRENAERRENELLDKIIALANLPAARHLNPPPQPPSPPRLTRTRIHWPASDFGEGAAVGVPEKQAGGGED